MNSAAGATEFDPGGGSLAAVPPPTSGRRFARWLRRFLFGHKPALVGSALVAMILIVAVVGPFTVGFGPAEPTGIAYGEPTAAHWLGTDSQSYDLLSRIVNGARTTLWIALLATLLSLVIGTLAGAVSGFAGGTTDLLIMRMVDFGMSFPSFLLAMVTVALLGKSLDNLIYAVGIVGAPMFARQVRAEVLRVKSMEYVTAARALGSPAWRVLAFHVMPNSLAPIIVLGTLAMGSAILSVAGLAFLGMAGDPYQQPEWGLILKQGWDEASKGQLQVLVAGGAIFLSVLGFNLVGDGLKDELDPRTRRR